MFTKEQLREAIAIAFAIGHRWSDPESTSDSIEYALKNHEKPEHVEGSMRETAILEAIGPETTPPSPPGYSRAFVEAVAQRALCVGARVRVLTDLPANTFPKVTQWGIIAAEAVLFTGTNCAQDSQDTKTLIPHCIAFAEDQLGEKEKATEPDVSKQLLGAPARIKLSSGVFAEGHVVAVNDGLIDIEETIGGVSGQIVGTAAEANTGNAKPSANKTVGFFFKNALTLWNLGFEAGKLGASWHDVKDESWKMGCIAGRNVAAAEELLERLKAQGKKTDQ